MENRKMTPEEIAAKSGCGPMMGAGCTIVIVGTTIITALIVVASEALK